MSDPCVIALLISHNAHVTLPQDEQFFYQGTPETEGKQRKDACCARSWMVLGPKSARRCSFRSELLRLRPRSHQASATSSGTSASVRHRCIWPCTCSGNKHADTTGPRLAQAKPASDAGPAFSERRADLSATRTLIT
eukprot:553646-Rhodomonas_salina.2